MALARLREIEEEGVKQRSKEVLIVAPVEIANYLLNQKREHIAMIESRFGLSVRVEGDPSLISPDYRVERFKTASRIMPVASAALPVVAYPDDVEEELAEEEEVAVAEAAEPTSGAAETGQAEKTNGKRKRRRRRRGGKGGENGHEPRGRVRGGLPSPQKSRTPSPPTNRPTRSRPTRRLPRSRPNLHRPWPRRRSPRRAPDRAGARAAGLPRRRRRRRRRTPRKLPRRPFARRSIR